MQSVSEPSLEDLPNPAQRAQACEALASEAEARADYVAAAEGWRQASTNNPRHPGYVFRLVAALERVGCISEAEVITLDAQKTFPANSGFRHDYGWLAARQGKWSEALQRWQAGLLLFPDDDRLHAVVAVGLAATGQYSAAETFLREATNRFDKSVPLAIESAALAARQQKWDEAIAWWQKTTSLVPNDPDKVARLAQCLKSAGKADEALTLLLDAEKNLAPHVAVAVELARLSEPNWEDAIPLWQQALRRFPNSPLVHFGLGSALRRAGRPEQAEESLAISRASFPTHWQIAYEFALLASDRRDWNAAITRWEALLASAPNNVAGQQRLAEARWGATLDNMLEAPPTIGRYKGSTPREGDDQLTETELMMRFESLGQNCEFGLVQRYYGAEPLGLLRFASMARNKLVQALETQFAGVGDADQTTLIAKGDEYITGDKIYGMFSHTFINVHSVPLDALYPKQCKRIRFLRDKLLSDFVECEKTFVFTAYWENSDAEARSLLDALHKYGPARLLFVRSQTPEFSAGSVHDAGGGLMFGYLDRYGHGGIEHGWKISNEVWLNLCRKAYAMT